MWGVGIQKNFVENYCDAFTFQKFHDNLKIKYIFYYKRRGNMAYDKKISELNTKEQVEPLTDKEAGQLLDICDNKIDNATFEKLEDGVNNGAFQK